jgi:hypothetical protein
MAKHIHVKVALPNKDEKQAEAAKTSRLRALRLAKEATDRGEACREVTQTLLKSRTPRTGHPTPRASGDQHPISGLGVALTKTGHPTSSREGHNPIGRSTVMALASASEGAPSRYTSVTLRSRRKRREVTTELPPKITISTRSTISASATRVVLAIQRAHHTRSTGAPPILASCPNRAKLR